MRATIFLLGASLATGLLLFGIMHAIYPIFTFGQMVGFSFLVGALAIYGLVFKNTSGFLDFALAGTPAIEKLYSVPRHREAQKIKRLGKHYSFYLIPTATADDQDRGELVDVLRYLLTHHAFSAVYTARDHQSHSPEMAYRIAIQHRKPRCDFATIFPGRVEPISFETYMAGFNEDRHAVFFAQKRGFGDPGVVHCGNHVYQPVVIDRMHAADANIIEQLKAFLGADIQVICHVRSAPVDAKEAAKIRVINNLEAMIPKALLRDGKAEIDRKSALTRNLDHLVLMQSILWLRYCKDRFEPDVLFKRVRVFLDQTMQVVSIPPYQSLQNFIAFLPWLQTKMVTSKTGAGTTLDIDSATAALTHYHRWPGTSRGTRFQIPGTEPRFEVSFNLFESGENYNAIIAGTSGSGKSVLLGQILKDHLDQSEDNDAIVIEFGGSFSNLAECLDGVYVERESDFRLSPFPSNDAPEEEWPVLLATSFSLIFNFLLENQPEAALYPTMLELFIEAYADLDQRDEIHHVLDGMVSYLRDKAVAEAIYTQSKEALIDALISLKAVVGQQRFLGNPNHQTSRFTVFDLEGYGEGEVRSLVGLIRLLVQEKMVKPLRRGKTLVIYDEAHYYIKTSDRQLNVLGQDIQRDMRVSRKHGTALLVATQSLSDYRGSVLAENASHHLIMRCQGIPEPEQMPVGVEITPDETSQIQSFRPARSQGYSSLFLRTLSPTGIQRCFLGLRVPPKMLYLLISDKAAKACMRKARTDLGFDGIELLVDALLEVNPTFVWPGSGAWQTTVDQIQRGLS